MEVIVNPKTLDNGTNIIQLEQAAGAAIKSFKNAFGQYFLITFMLKCLS